MTIRVSYYERNRNTHRFYLGSIRKLNLMVLLFFCSTLEPSVYESDSHLVYSLITINVKCGYAEVKTHVKFYF